MTRPVIPQHYPAARLCDTCFWDLTGLRQDTVPDGTRCAAEACSRCGEHGQRLTPYRPAGPAQATACQPATITVTWWRPGHYTAEVNALALARRLRALPQPEEEAAAVAEQIAWHELTDGHAAVDHTTDGPDTPGLDILIEVIAGQADALRIEEEGPGGPDDEDDADDYRLRLDPPSPGLDCRFDAQPHADKGTWGLTGVNRGGHRLFTCNAAGHHVLIEPHPDAGHECVPACSSYTPGQETT